MQKIFTLFLRINIPQNVINLLYSSLISKKIKKNLFY